MFVGICQSPLEIYWGAEIPPPGLYPGNSGRTLGGVRRLAEQLKRKQTLVKQGEEDVVQGILEQNLKKGKRSEGKLWLSYPF